MVNNIKINSDLNFAFLFRWILLSFLLHVVFVLYEIKYVNVHLKDYKLLKKEQLANNDNERVF